MVDAGVATIGDDGEGVLFLALGIPHFAAAADHGGHGGVDDDVTGYVQIGDALVAVDHGEGWTAGVGGFDVGLNFRFLVGGQGIEFGHEVAEAVVEVDADCGQCGAVFGDDVFEEGANGVTEDDRVADLHHGGLQVQGEEQSVRLGLGDLIFEKGDEGAPAHGGGVHDLARLEGEFRQQREGAAVLGGQFDLYFGGGGQGGGFLVREEVILSHRANPGFRVGRPLAHRVRVLAGVFFDGFGGAAVGVTFAQHRVDGAAHDFRVFGFDFLRGVGLRVFREVGQVVAFSLQFGDGGLQLRY